MLLVFSIALTPWSAIHHHQEVETHTVKEDHCTHKLHLSKHVETCLVCEAHFIKDFITTTTAIQLFSTVAYYIKTPVQLSSSYAMLLKTALRGPPATPVA